VVGLAGVGAPDQLRRAHRRMTDWAGPVERATVGLLLITAALVGAAALA
jgi:hypothetical protein